LLRKKNPKIEALAVTLKKPRQGRKGEGGVSHSVGG